MRWLVIGIAALLVGLLAYGVAGQGTDTTIDAALQKGEKVEAPEKDLPRLGEAGKGRLSDYKGKVVLVNFWASWCPPCTEELPLLEKTQQQMAKAGGIGLAAQLARGAQAALVNDKVAPQADAGANARSLLLSAIERRVTGAIMPSAANDDDDGGGDDFDTTTGPAA